MIQILHGPQLNTACAACSRLSEQRLMCSKTQGHQFVMLTGLCSPGSEEGGEPVTAGRKEEYPWRYCRIQAYPRFGYYVVVELTLQQKRNQLFTESEEVTVQIDTSDQRNKSLRRQLSGELNTCSI